MANLSQQLDRVADAFKHARTLYQFGHGGAVDLKQCVLQPALVQSLQGDAEREIMASSARTHFVTGGALTVAETGEVTWTSFNTASASGVQAVSSLHGKVRCSSPCLELHCA